MNNLMKFLKCVITTSFFSGLFFITACDSDKDEALQLMYVEDNSATYYFNPAEEDKELTALTIVGGDGNYSVESRNPALIEVDLKFPNAFTVKPKDIGKTEIIVKDGSGQQYVLQVHIIYYSEEWKIGECSVRVVDEEGILSDAEKTQLKTEALASIPVQAGGGYRILYNNKESVSKGSLTIYPKEYGKDGISLEGERLMPEESSTGLVHGFRFYTEEGVERVFRLVPYDKDLRMSVVVPHALEEEVTGLIESGFEGVKVFTLQHVAAR